MDLDRFVSSGYIKYYQPTLAEIKKSWLLTYTYIYTTQFIAKLFGNKKFRAVENEFAIVTTLKKVSSGSKDYIFYDTIYWLINYLGNGLSYVLPWLWGFLRHGSFLF